jgi:uncharacterized LabA/DUF88 family protein
MVLFLTSSSDKIMVFIDGANFFYSSKRAGLEKTSIKKLVEVVAEKRNLRRAYYYSSYIANDSKKLKFFEELKKEGIETRVAELRVTDSGAKEKGIDILLAVDMLKLCRNNAYDTAVLVSGDEDFCELVSAVKDFGARVEVAAFSNSLSSKLAKCVDGIILLDGYKEKIKI